MITGHRQDFVALVQALTKRNEPEPIPLSMGACIVTNYNNWDRINQLRRQWQAANPENVSDAGWATELRWGIIPYKHLYRDTFIILSDGPYSGLSANEMGLSKEAWAELSLTIRLEHECAHYFTHRVAQSMRNRLLDELIADYRGIVAANGRYRADWFLRFMGLEAYPAYREGGRLQNYRGHPSLSDEAFEILKTLVVYAAQNLERFHRHHVQQPQTETAQAQLLVALTQLTFEEFATKQFGEFEEKIQRLAADGLFY
jgi:hypothetical protein